MSLQLPRFMQEVVYTEQINRCLTCLDPSDFHHAYLRYVDEETVTAQLHSSRRLNRYTVKYWDVHTQPQGLIWSPNSAGSNLGDYFTENISKHPFHRESEDWGSGCHHRDHLPDHRTPPTNPWQMTIDSYVVFNVQWKYLNALTFWRYSL